MTAIADRYRRLAAAMEERIAAVPDDRWGSPAPCEGWTARDVVKHLVDTPAMFFGLVNQPAPAGGPSVDDDPVGAFAHVRDAVQGALDDPAVADLPYEGLMGASTFAKGLDQFLSADLVIHAWDLARATGQDDRLDPDEVHRLHERMLPMDEMLRAPGAFGPKIEPPAGADEQTQLLCFLGRRV
jgi:uncharacterized protein (TIGR03086 family)